METFVLTVLLSNVLDVCEVFDSQAAALESARYYCQYNNIRINDHQVYDEKMNGWLVSDDYGYFVSVVRRYSLSDITTHFSSYATFANKIAGYQYGYRKSYYPTIYDVSYVGGFGPPITIKPTAEEMAAFPTTPITPKVVEPVAPKPKPDDPKEEDLPAGFDYSGKPVKMIDVYDDPFNVVDVNSLSEEQKWALITARTRRRPNQVIIIKGMGCWSQHYMLKELAAKNSLGIMMRNQELNYLRDLFQQLRDQAEESSSSYNEDEELDE